MTPDPIGLAGGMNLFGYVDSVGKPHFDKNLYTYTGNNPVNVIDPIGLWGFGPIVSGSAEIGIGVAGAGAAGDAGAGLFWSGFLRRLNLGAFAGWGGFVGGIEETNRDRIGYPSSPCNKPASILGLFAGGGGGLFLTNAESASQLSGPFDTSFINVALAGFIKFSVQFGRDAKGTWIGSITLGPGWGISGSTYPTNTWGTR